MEELAYDVPVESSLQQRNHIAESVRVAYFARLNRVCIIRRMEQVDR